MTNKAIRLPIVSGEGGKPPSDGNDASEVREDELLQVGELAKTCGKTVRAIHHYEDLGLLTPHKRSKGRYRLYAPDAIDRVKWISKLHDLGMTLTQVQEIVSNYEAAPTAAEAMAKVKAVYEQKLSEVREQIAHMASLERELEASLAYLDTCESDCKPQELVAACSCCTVHDEDAVEPPLITGLHAN